MNIWRDLESAPVGTGAALAEAIERLAWNDAGLVPAIARRHGTGEVLMLAWMNRAALSETLVTGRVCYFSRSRHRLWRKGEESGHVQRLVEMRFDCDGDVVLLDVEQTGPACHTNRANCFYLKVDGDRVVVADAPIPE